MLEELKQRVLDANLLLPKYGLSHSHGEMYLKSIEKKEL